ncbi:intestinal mucin-like protein [Menidia menidia]
MTNVSEGCCSYMKCDCVCTLYGDPHYTSFQGVNFDVLDQCSYTLVEEQYARHNLTIVVDNNHCSPGGSCVKGVFLKYKGTTATLTVSGSDVKATMNNVTIQPPYEGNGLRFETTGYEVFIHIPGIRSQVSLTERSRLEVRLDYDRFYKNTRGQCGVCGGKSCMRRDGFAEVDSCCDKTALDWVYRDPKKPECERKDVPCTPPSPYTRPTSPPTTCPPHPHCQLLDHPVFENCSKSVNLSSMMRSCEFDSCRGPSSYCSSLEEAAEECKRVGFCVDWRSLTNGSCDVECEEGMVFKECAKEMDDVCDGGKIKPGEPLEKLTAGCFCPYGFIKAGDHLEKCVKECNYCKGPFGEPRMPGEEWESNCHVCTCNNQTREEECREKPHMTPPTCRPDEVLVNTSCCSEQMCVARTCSYNGTTYKVGDEWTDPAHPCSSFSCSTEGVQTETKVCPSENCSEADRVWDDQHCCFSCKPLCGPRVSSLNVSVGSCSAELQLPVCHGQCETTPSLSVGALSTAAPVSAPPPYRLFLNQPCGCCQQLDSDWRNVTLNCSGPGSQTLEVQYQHVTSCHCTACT